MTTRTALKVNYFGAGIGLAGDISDGIDKLMT